MRARRRPAVSLAVALAVAGGGAALAVGPAAVASASGGEVAPAASSHREYVRITLPDGRVAKLVQGGKEGPRAEIALANGSRVGRVDGAHPRALSGGWTYRLVRDGAVTKFVVVDGRGGGCRWVYDFGGRLVEKHSVDRAAAARAKARQDGGGSVGGKDTAYKKSPTTPLGPVGAGAGQPGAEGGRGSSPSLLAAGGGVAAVGAAGLGFALLRRRTPVAG